MNLDDKLIYDICLWKYNFGWRHHRLENPIDIKINTIEERGNDILVSFDIINFSACTNETDVEDKFKPEIIHYYEAGRRISSKTSSYAFCLQKVEYLNLLRQKRLKIIGIYDFYK